MDWRLGWETTSVNENHWKEVQAALQREYFALMQAPECIEWNEQVANEVCASLAHSAYHLGAMRQMLKARSAKRYDDIHVEKTFRTLCWPTDSIHEFPQRMPVCKLPFPEVLAR
jgi:hypothetical protein